MKQKVLEVLNDRLTLIKGLTQKHEDELKVATDSQRKAYLKDMVTFHKRQIIDIDNAIAWVKTIKE